MLKLKLKKIPKKRVVIISVVLLLLCVSSTFLFIMYASKVDPTVANITPSALDVANGTITINDLDADWNYYQGLNFTTITSQDQIPDGIDKGYYTEENLIPVKVVYHGDDVDHIGDANYRGYVSPVGDEASIHTYVYYKYLPLNGDGTITLELIDNPYSVRPTGKGFNGWIPVVRNSDSRVDGEVYIEEDDVTLYYDSQEYVRSAKVNVADTTSTLPLTIDFYVSWADANVQTGGSAVLEYLDLEGMKQVTFSETTGDLAFYDNLVYFEVEQERAAKNTTFTGLYYVGTNNDYRYFVDGLCDVKFGTCAYYPVTTDTAPVPGKTYVVSIDYGNPIQVSTDMEGYQTYFKNSAIDFNMAGYYYLEDSTGNASLYYDEMGNSCSKTNCASGATYRLIQTGESFSSPQIMYEQIEDGFRVFSSAADLTKYYYLVTRDMNILINDVDDANIISYMSTKPYTLTSSSNRMYFADGNNAVLQNDMVIENVVLDSDQNLTGWMGAVRENVDTTAAIIANSNNLKIGRNISRYNTNQFSTYGVYGYGDGQPTNKRFRIIVESGVYNYLVGSGSSGVTVTDLNSNYIYGSDYDRVTNVNNKMYVIFCAMSSWYNSLVASDNGYSPVTNMVVKSGSYGKSINDQHSGDYSHGIYIGGRGSTSSNAQALRQLKVEGGDINVINGGPCVSTNFKNKNTVALYMTGGLVRSIYGGAGQSATYGNRIISITGGNVTNNVFGGSNSYQGTEDDGTLYGNTLLYFGGTSQIGGATTNLFNAKPGDVFGAGAGRNGEDYRELGTIAGATIVVNDDAHIMGDLYGGGNYGTTGRATAEYSETIMYLNGGIIDGNVYGSSNNNGSGRKEETITANFSKINYYMITYQVGLGGTIPGLRSYYSYRNYNQGDYNCTGGDQVQNSDTCTYAGTNRGFYVHIGDYYSYLFDNTRVEEDMICTEDNPGWNGSACLYASLAILAGEDTKKYDALLPNGYYKPYYIQDINGISYTQGAWSLPNDVTTTFGDEAHTIIINQNGSSIGGSLYGGANSSGTVFANVKINLNGGTILGDAFGGGLGDETYVSGSIEVNINGIESPTTDVYGGSAYGFIGYSDESDAAKTNPRTTKVNLNSGSVNDVYGGSMGSAAIMPLVNTYCVVTVNGGSASSVYGGSNINAETTYRSVVNINGGYVNYVYGGSNRLGSILPTDVNMNGGTVENLFGGSNVSGTTNNNNVKVNGGTALNVYGGNNAGGTAVNNKVSLLGGNVNNVYGCGKGSGTSCTKSYVLIDGINDSSSNVFGGGEEASTTTSRILLQTGTVGSIFGGNNKNGNVTTSNVYLAGGKATNVYGGNNISGETENANVFVGAGSFTSVYGGGFEATTVNATVEMIDGVVEFVYGGGNNASVTNPVVNVSGGTATNVYGGSNSSGTISDSLVNVGTDYVHVPEIFDEPSGGDDPSGDEPSGGQDPDPGSLIDSEKKAIMDQLQFNVTVSDKRFAQGWLTGAPDGYPYGMQLELNVYNPTDTTVTVPFKVVLRADTPFSIFFNGPNYYSATNWIKDAYGYYATNECNYDWICTDTLYFAPGTTTLRTFYVATLTVNPKFYFGFDYQFDDSDFSGVVGGDGTVDADLIELNKVLFEKPIFTMGEFSVVNVYGGNNAGGRTLTSHVNILEKAQVTDVYGGGNEAVTVNTNVIVNGGLIENLYGGGNGAAAVVSENTYVLLNDGTINNNVFGGGNAAPVTGNSEVNMLNGNINGSVYGSGNMAYTGDVTVLNDGTVVPNGTNTFSMSTINIIGGNIKRHVFGAANSSFVYGDTLINIGDSAISAFNPDDKGLPYDKNIYIGGTVYGGSNTNEEGDTQFQDGSYSVYGEILINVEGTTYIDSADKITLDMKGSIYGSGNATTAKRNGIINIKNLGRNGNHVSLTSLQRAGEVNITDSYIQITGAKDSTSSEIALYVFNYIDNVNMIGSNELYLNSGANVTKAIHSLDEDENPQRVTIVDGKITSQNGNNKIYMYQDRKLDIAITKLLTGVNSAEARGIVDGMAFLGMYYSDEDGNIVKGMYDTTYETGDTLVEGDSIFSGYGTFVTGFPLLGDADEEFYKLDGYYTNYYDEETGLMTIDYVEPMDKTGYYQWLVGVEVQDLYVALEATRYSTYGAVPLSLNLDSLLGADVFFDVLSFNSSELKGELIDKGNIPKIADTTAQANSTFALSMGTSQIGWKDNSSTDYYTDDMFDGDSRYTYDSKTGARELLFYLYHSKNIDVTDEMDMDEEGNLDGQVSLGTVRILVDATSILEDNTETNTTQVAINVEIFLTEKTADGYSHALAPGKKYSVFPSRVVNIDSSSAFSFYQSVYVKMGTLDSKEDPWTLEKLYPDTVQRQIVLGNVLPVGTTVTMIDSAANKLYYYDVTEENITAKMQEFALKDEVAYQLSDFIEMGVVDKTDTSAYYNDLNSQKKYYYNSEDDSAMEEFIFIIDFAEASENITDDIKSYIAMELIDKPNNNKIILSTLGMYEVDCAYNVYTGDGSSLGIDAVLGKDVIYVGEKTNLDLDISLIQQSATSSNGVSVSVYDSSYDEYKLGAVIKIYDANGKLVDGTSLMGLSFKVGDKIYYPQTDGTVRLELAGRVTDIKSIIDLEITNSDLQTGSYILNVEVFGSYDGLYYGDKETYAAQVPFELVNNTYGLKVTIPDDSVVRDKITGTNEDGSSKLPIRIHATGNFDATNIRIALQRRIYGNDKENDDDVYNLEYEDVDLLNFFTEEYGILGTDNTSLTQNTFVPCDDTDMLDYYLIDNYNDFVETNGVEEFILDMSMKNNTSTGWKTGTYRIVVSIYDDSTLIGKTYQYIFIRDTKLSDNYNEEDGNGS